MVRFISLNVRGLANDNKRRIIMHKLRKRGDIILLQETHCTPVLQNIWQNEWGGKMYFSNGTSNSKGVCIMLSKNVPVQVIKSEKDDVGRLLILELKIEEILLTLVNIYAPNKDDPNFFNELNKRLSSFSENKLIMGDFNLALDPLIDRLNTYQNNNKSKEVVLKIIQDYVLYDVWRVRYENERQYSWYKKERNSDVKASRIDLALCSMNLNVENVLYFPATYTDHRALYVAIKCYKGQERGPGFWKFNCLYLQQSEFCSYMNDRLDEMLNNSLHMNPNDRWIYLKDNIKKVAQKYSRKARSEDTLVISQLMEKIDGYQSRLPLEECEYDLLENSKIELEELQNKVIQGVMFRSKARWFLECEKNTKYFFSLEKAKYNAKVCSVLLVGDQEITDHHQILQAQVDFYQELYTADPTIVFDIVNNTAIKVPKELYQIQNKPFDLEQLGRAALLMQNNKTPGCDGIPVDFYKIFWSKLGKPFADMVEHSYGKGMLPGNVRQGVLNLIPKNGKDQRLLKNLRPITLLNADYKIIEKAISMRLKDALKIIINKDQTGFMSNRLISTNIRKIFDILYYTKEENLDALVLSCDFLKCFDRVEFSCIEGSLNYFGFAPYLVDWVKVLYNTFSIKIQNNGYFSQSIGITRSIHQGGCCSAELFLICAEILAILIRNDSNIHGIPVNEIINLLNQFADDLDVSLLAEEESLNALLNVFEFYRSRSGFTLSYDKTQLYRIGSMRNSNAKYNTQFPIQWTNKPICVLGIWITHDYKEAMELNYEDIYNKIGNILGNWENRDLSLIGKITVINTLIASLFVYRMQVLPLLDNKKIKEIEDLFRRFIWQGRKEKIKLAILQRPKNEGGLGLVNLYLKDRAIKISWIKILSEEPKCANLAYATLNNDMKGGYLEMQPISKRY